MAKLTSKFSSMTLAQIKKEIEGEVLKSVLHTLSEDNHCPMLISINSIELEPIPDTDFDEEENESIISCDALTVYGIIRYPGNTPKDKQFVTWVEWNYEYEEASSSMFKCAIIDAPTLDDLARKYLSKNKK